jgi:hypothetical protein
MPRTSPLVYGMSAVDVHGRLTCRVVTAALGWVEGTRWTARETEGVLVITADPGGVHVVGVQDRLRIPAQSRARFGVRPGDRVLLVADPPFARLTVYPPGALDQLLASGQVESSVHAMSSADRQGRICCRVATRSLRWEIGTRLTMRENDDMLVITADPTGVHTIGVQRRFRLPTATQLRFGLRPADRVLLLADPASDRLVLYPPIVLDGLITAAHDPTRTALDAAAVTEDGAR